MSVATNKENQAMAQGASTDLVNGTRVVIDQGQLDGYNKDSAQDFSLGGFDPIIGGNALKDIFGGGNSGRARRKAEEKTAANYMQNWGMSNVASLNPFQDQAIDTRWGHELPGTYVSPEDSGAVYVNPGQAGEDPQNTQAELLRLGYDEWVKQFQPAEGDLLAMTTYDGNKGLAGGIIDRQMVNIDNNRISAEGQQQRGMARYGMQQTKEQAAASAAGMEQSTALAKVDAINKTNRWQDDLNREIMSTGVSANTALKPKTE